MRVSAAQSEAEIWKLSDERQDGNQVLYWDADWKETQDQSAAAYAGQSGQSSKEGGMQNLQIVIGKPENAGRTVCAGSSEICETIARRTAKWEKQEPGQTAGGGSQETSGG